MTAPSPLALAPWRDRILAAATPLRAVGMAAELALAQEDLRVTPQAFVIPVSDTPVSRPGAGNSVLAQRVNAVVGIVLAVSSLRDSRTGSDLVDDLTPIRSPIWDALLGWRPPGAEGAIQFAGGQLLAFHDSTIWWTDRFVTSYFVRKEFN